MGAAIAHNRPKTNSCGHFEAKLAYFNRNPKKFLRRFVTMDETWIHRYAPESHEGSKQWVEHDESAPKRPKCSNWLGKLWWLLFVPKPQEMAVWMET